MFEHELIAVMLCCNHGRNGAFAEKLFATEVGPNMRFESRGFCDEDGPPLQYRVNADNTRPLIRAIDLAGREFAVESYRPHVGNWCWDEISMRGEVVLNLLNWPTFREHFHIVEGETRLFNWWNAAGEWKDDDLRLIGKRF